jgi:hypothetical protein
MKKLIFLLFLSGCTWQQHVSRVEKSAPYFKQVETIGLSSITDTLNGVPFTLNQWGCPKGELFCKGYEFENGTRIDSFFYQDGKPKQYRFFRKAKPMINYLYDTSAYTFFDKQGRPIKSQFSIYKPDTNYQYYQYYSEFGGRLPQKHPVLIYPLKEI